MKRIAIFLALLLGVVQMSAQTIEFSPSPDVKMERDSTLIDGDFFPTGVTCLMKSY